MEVLARVCNPLPIVIKGMIFMKDSVTEKTVDKTSGNSPIRNSYMTVESASVFKAKVESLRCEIDTINKDISEIHQKQELLDKSLDTLKSDMSLNYLQLKESIKWSNKAMIIQSVILAILIAISFFVR